MAGIFNRAIFNDAIFNTAEAVPADEIVSGGKGDNDGARRSIFKPLGILHRPQKPVRPTLNARLLETSDDAAEIAERLAREFAEESQALAEVSSMTQSQIDAEIGTRLRDKLRAEEDELFLLVMVAAAVA